jgi:hypothetical protein
MIITLVPKEALPDVWPEASQFIQKALDAAPGYYRPVDVLHNIINEMETLWAVYDDDKTMQACFTTIINQYPLCRRVMVHHVGGAYLDEWQDDSWAILKNYARDTGCSGVDARGREGWRPRARSLGIRIITTYSYDLES